ncbi:MAG TPA: 1,4-dihydroxy-2-naphthoate octaprenyltransferase [Syntrophales bacterium]|nr:1,4-dihydroxy-2-naphthoate octaprenyltransferase [Syntrophales bacterium]
MGARGTSSAGEQRRNLLSVWFQAARPFSLTASVLPVVIGAVLAATVDGPVDWPLFPLIVACSLLFHIGTNMVSDYFDYSRGVDRDETFGSSRVLIEGLLTPKQLLAAGVILFAVGFSLGLLLVAVRGWPIFILGVIGLLGGWFYTGGPVAYKYVALGDILVFVLMGPLMVIGSFLALTGGFSMTVLYASLPVGCLVAAILHANNLRDITHDARANIKTMAMVLGLPAAKAIYLGLVVGAYLVVLVMVLGKLVTPLALAVLITLPLAVRNVKAVLASVPGRPETIAMGDVMTAQLHLAFCTLFGIAIFIGTFLK